MPIVRGPGSLFGLLDGSAAVPGLAWVNDQDTGFYRIGADNLGLALGGAIELNFTATALSPGANNGNALGTAALQWSDLFLASGAVINFDNGNVTLTHAGGMLTLKDATLFRLGDDGDQVLINRSTLLAANTALTDVLIGTPVTPIGPAANSLIIGNVTASGDVLIAVNKGGTSHMAFMADGSTGDTLIGVSTGQSFDVYIAGTKEIDYATGALAFQQATTISTTATTLTLSPATDVHISDAKGLVVGHTAQITLAGVVDNPELQALGTAASDSAILLAQFSAGGDGPRLLCTKSRNAAIGSFTIVAADDTLGEQIFMGDDGVDYGSIGGLIRCSVDGTPGVADMPGRLMFLTTLDGSQTATERLRITNAGVITTLAAAAANVTAAGAGIFGGGIAFTDVADAHIDDATHGTGTTTIYIGNQTITTSSDIRLKRDVEDSRVHALDTLGRLRVVDYTWGDNYGAHKAYNARGRWTGITAQDLYQTVPYVINTNGGQECPNCQRGLHCSMHTEWFVQYDHLVPMLVKAIQELNAKVEARS